jgi:hypothetical protein
MMYIRVLLVPVIAFGWACSGIRAGAFSCHDYRDKLEVCLGEPTFTCGAAGQNSTVSYRRSVNDHGGIQLDLYLSMMWDAPSRIENYTASPENDLVATHVYDKPGTYELRWNITHGGQGIYNCDFGAEVCTPRYAFIVTNDGCSVIPDHDDNKEASGYKESRLWYFVWLVFAACVGLSVLDRVS